MMQLSKQPLTHSILRNSQSRRQSSRHQEDQQTNTKKSNTYNKIVSNQQRIFNNFSHSNYYHPVVNFNRLSSSQVQNRQHQHLINPTNTNKSQILIKQKHQNIIVCQSLPKTRPKYSFTFGHVKQQINQQQINIINNNIINKNGKQQSLRNNVTQQQTSQMVINSQRQQSTITSRNIRKDIDICLYTIADRLNQQQQNYYQPQKFNKQTKQFVTNKLGSLQYKPSFSQLRKNKKMFLDKSIHRIHPQIVDQYIQMVYREYNIPSVIREEESGVKGKVLGEVVDERREKQQESLKQRTNQYKSKNQQRVSFQTRQSQPLQRQTNSIIQNQPFRQSQYNLFNTKHSRKNNLISQKQLLKQSNKKQKKRFLNLTLSKQKQEIIKVKKFQSPMKINEKQQKLKQKQKRQQSQSSKSQSVKKSSSQKKIMQIKKNIAQWRDSQHQYAQRYSYLQSPYEMIKGRQKQYQNKGQQQSSRQVNVVVRPFEEMMRVTGQQGQQQQIMHHGIKTVTTQYVTNPTSSQYHNEQQSKYIHSFSTHPQTQITEQFRYCPLCEQKVLTGNLIKHQQKCIGWIDDRGQLVMFKELYVMDEGRLGELMKVRIKEIRGRVGRLVEKLRLKQQQTAKEQRQTLDGKILRAVEEFIHNYTMLQQNPINIPSKHLLSSNYNTLHKILRNDQSLILLQETNKLYWFITLVERYQNSKKNINKNKPSTYKSQQIQKYNQSIIKHQNNVSTMAKLNQSLNFVHERQQQGKINGHVSQFVDVRNSMF